MSLTDLQLAYFKAQLGDERTRLLESEHGAVHSNLDRVDIKVTHPNNSDETMRADAVETDIALEGHVLESIAHVDLALERINSRDYGVCIDCHTNIPYQRLYAFPAAARCVACKSVFEQPP
jgi:RNA polymerase-binding transcription factor DksA